MKKSTVKCKCSGCRSLLLKDMNDEQLRRYFRCSICKKMDIEYYMVHDRLWYNAEVYHDGFSCLACLEKAIKRELYVTDFTEAPINDILREAFHRGKVSGLINPLARFGFLLRDRYIKKVKIEE